MKKRYAERLISMGFWGLMSRHHVMETCFEARDLFESETRLLHKSTEVWILGVVQELERFAEAERKTLVYQYYISSLASSSSCDIFLFHRIL